jgi:hypothetical protein
LRHLSRPQRQPRLPARVRFATFFDVGGIIIRRLSYPAKVISELVLGIGQGRLQPPAIGVADGQPHLMSGNP